VQGECSSSLVEFVAGALASLTQGALLVDSEERVGVSVHLEHLGGDLGESHHIVRASLGGVSVLGGEEGEGGDQSGHGLVGDIDLGGVAGLETLTVGTEAHRGLEALAALGLVGLVFVEAEAGADGAFILVAAVEGELGGLALGGGNAETAAASGRLEDASIVAADEAARIRELEAVAVGVGVATSLDLTSEVGALLSETHTRGLGEQGPTTLALVRSRVGAVELGLADFTDGLTRSLVLRTLQFKELGHWKLSLIGVSVPLIVLGNELRGAGDIHASKFEIDHVIRGESLVLVGRAARFEGRGGAGVGDGGAGDQRHSRGLGNHIGSVADLAGVSSHIELVSHGPSAGLGIFAG